MNRSVIMSPESPVFFQSPLVFSPTSVKTPSSSPRSTPPKLSMVACPPRKLIETTPSPDFDSVLKRKRPPMLDLITVAPPVPSWCNTTVKTPEKAAEVVEAEKDGYYFVYCKRGRRGPMEDRYFAEVESDDEGPRKKAFFGVFDGHGGSNAAEFAAMNLRNNIEAAMAGERSREDGYSIERAIRDGYNKTDEDFLKEGSKGGACCVTALISNGELAVSNAGDCRAVISRGGVAEALTTDHNPSQANELKRIEALGGYVDCCNGVWRIQGTLAVSRGIGDRYLKKWVIAEPETRTLRIKPELEFLILASDGLWDKVTNQEAVDVVRPYCVGVENPKTLSACKKLAELSFDVSYVTEASLDIRIQSFEEMEVELLLVKALEMLEKLRNVEKLTLGSNFLKIISLAELQRVPFPMFNVKDLTFKAMLSQYVIPGIVRMLQNSPQVKNLTLHTKDIHGTIPLKD
ncbi:unnamed protein product [Arabis nemorensis]|uniref:protein-serine/threonine phosphatase n=1 Tax=Arabis nemorensis TaxID=586526 RepID=A0A565BPL9_9BRAS|nr:unnamed protein product [Arabis nemorensis]